MELLQLRYFFESARDESFARTAEKHLVPTTSVSASVRRLERELGCRLFDRSGNGIRLNDNGRKLQQALCLVFAHLDAVVEELSPHTPPVRPVTLLVRGMRRRITELITEFSTKHPDVAFQTVFDFGETDPERYDIIIDEASDGYNGWERFELYSMRLRFKCAPGDPLVGKALTLQQLAGRKFVTMGEKSNLHQVLLEACARAGFQPEIAVQCNDIECYEKLIAAGLGIAVGREQPDPNVAWLDVTDFDRRYTLCVYYRSNSHRGTVRTFLDFLRSQ